MLAIRLPQLALQGGPSCRIARLIRVLKNRGRGLDFRSHAGKELVDKEVDDGLIGVDHNIQRQSLCDRHDLAGTNGGIAVGIIAIRHTIASRSTEIHNKARIGILLKCVLRGHGTQNFIGGIEKATRSTIGHTKQEGIWGLSARIGSRLSSVRLKGSKGKLHRRLQNLVLDNCKVRQL